MSRSVPVVLWQRLIDWFGLMWAIYRPYTPERSRTYVHIGATGEYAQILSHTAEIRVSDDLETNREFERYVHAELNVIEAELTAGLDQVFAATLAELGLSFADYAESTMDELNEYLREAAEAVTV